MQIENRRIEQHVCLNLIVPLACSAHANQRTQCMYENFSNHVMKVQATVVAVQGIASCIIAASKAKVTTSTNVATVAIWDKSVLESCLVEESLADTSGHIKKNQKVLDKCLAAAIA